LAGAEDKFEFVHIRHAKNRFPKVLVGTGVVALRKREGQDFE
jgi:hypothetical protein